VRMARRPEGIEGAAGSLYGWGSQSMVSGAGRNTPESALARAVRSPLTRLKQASQGNDNAPELLTVLHLVLSEQRRTNALLEDVRRSSR
jgi:hypothetical protein